MHTISRRVLVIDDNPAIHQDFRKILNPGAGSGKLDVAEAALFGVSAAPGAMADYEFDFAFQGEQALALVQQALAEQRPYATAFMDVRMPPGWDGIETAARIRYTPAFRRGAGLSQKSGCRQASLTLRVIAIRR